MCAWFYFFCPLNQLQSQEFWKLRDMIDKELANDVIKELINHNKQKLTKFGRDDVKKKAFVFLLIVYTEY